MGLQFQHPAVRISEKPKPDDTLSPLQGPQDGSLQSISRHAAFKGLFLFGDRRTVGLRNAVRRATRQQQPECHITQIISYRSIVIRTGSDSGPNAVLVQPSLPPIGLEAD